MNESNAMALADNAMGAVDWDALHDRSRVIFDAVHRGSSLALQSGLYGTPPVDPTQAAMDRYKQYIPLQQARGPIETVKDAFSPRLDEQGNPKADSLGSILNAALMVVPGMRGLKRQSPPAPVQPNMNGDSLLTAMRRDTISRAGEGRIEGGRPVETFNLSNTNPQNIATSRKVQANQLKARWDKNGPDYDEADFMETPRGDKLWGKEVKAWNKEFGTNFDPNKMPIDASTQGIVDRYRSKYIGNQKAKFTGVDDANDFFHDNDMPENAVHLRGKIPEEFR